MCKLIGINQVKLGQRTIGLEMYSLDKQEVLGYTEKGLKDAIQNGDTVFGMHITPDGGQLELNDGFNMMNKIGINTFVPVKDTASMIADLYNLIEVKEVKGVKTFRFVTQRFGFKELSENKLIALMEIAEGSINGVKLVDGKIVTMFDMQSVSTSEKSNTPKDTQKK